MSQLPTSRKIAYAAGGLGMNLPNLIISQWIFKRYVPDAENALVPVALFSTIFLLGRVTDGVSDPLIAYWSDRHRGRYGRRLPFILASLLPLALVFFLLWTPPVDHLHWGNAVFALVLVQAYFLLYTAITTPYLALLPEITSDPKERVNVATWQAVFVMIGTAVFASIGVVIESAGWVALGAVGAVLTGLSFAPTLLFIRERRRTSGEDHGDGVEPADDGEAPGSGEGPPPTRVSLISWIAMTLGNRPFRFLVMTTSLYWFGLNLLIMLVPYWVQDLLGLGEGAVTTVMGPFLLMNTVFFVVFNALAKRVGKFPVFLITLGGSALTAPLLSAAGHLPLGSGLVQTAVAMGVIGIPVAGFMMLPFALLADVVDHDEVLTGRRREAIYFGVQAVFQKLTIGLSIWLFGVFVLAGGESVSGTGALRAVPLIAAGSFALGLVAFLRYPLREGPDGPILVRGAAGPAAGATR